MSEALKYAIEMIADTESTVSMEIVEINPFLDEHNRIPLGVELVLSALGQKNPFQNVTPIAAASLARSAPRAAPANIRPAAPRPPTPQSFHQTSAGPSPSPRTTATEPA